MRPYNDYKLLSNINLRLTVCHSSPTPIFRRLLGRVGDKTHLIDAGQQTQFLAKFQLGFISDRLRGVWRRDGGPSWIKDANVTGRVNLREALNHRSVRRLLRSINRLVVLRKQGGRRQLTAWLVDNEIVENGRVSAVAFAAGD